MIFCSNLSVSFDFFVLPVPAYIQRNTVGLFKGYWPRYISYFHLNFINSTKFRTAQNTDLSKNHNLLSLHFPRTNYINKKKQK
ncbi:hypothetical protein BpHYR1_046605 [Brachionus plicatilis]|uniref:Uncharacterized protein n=1 Tax=Brachionus plicatilis TaxID=10195 RepID=A0A3M7S338_BRAPC|nr:hypothetical protein BpHYR1_046605 [Brachionus plicatilis]